MIKKNKKIILVAGDPNSINSEIIFKCWKKLNKNIKKKLFVIGNINLLKKQFYQLDYPIRIHEIKKLNEERINNKLKVINIDLEFKKPFKVEKKHASNYVIKSLNLAHKLALDGKTHGMINCAISKNLLKKKNTGVTEYLSQKCKLKNNSEIMMIQSKNFSICPLTTHLQIKNVAKNIKFNKITFKVNKIQKYFLKLYKKKPRIGILGLNPHNSEYLKNSEEIKEIIPAIKHLRKKGLNIEGPLVADTVFVNDYKNYDIIVGMYHDQVLAPFKTMFKFNAINLTLGLKYLRVSPDHGVAKNLIKNKKANPNSLLECINFINKFG